VVRNASNGTKLSGKQSPGKTKAANPSHPAQEIARPRIRGAARPARFCRRGALRPAEFPGVAQAGNPASYVKINVVKKD